MIRRPTRHLTLAAAGALLALSAAATAQPATGATKPKSEAKSPASPESRDRALEIIDRHIEASGGREAIASVEHVVSKATISIPSVGLEGTVTSYGSTDPIRSLIVVDMPGFGVQKTGFNGEVAWTLSPLGASLMDEDLRNAMMRDSDPHSDLKFEKNYDTIEYAGTQDFQGQRAEAVRLVDHAGRESTHFYSVDSGLRIGIKAVQPSEMGDTPVTMSFSDYVEFNGIMYPSKSVQQLGPQKFTMTFDSVSHDEIPAETYQLPDAIKVLVEQEKADEDGDDAP